jgi:hypothetical protein
MIDPREQTLAELRHLSICLKYIACEVDLIGTSLRNGVISVETAQEWTGSLEDPVGLFDREAKQ